MTHTIRYKPLPFRTNPAPTHVPGYVPQKVTTTTPHSNYNIPYQPPGEMGNPWYLPLVFIGLTVIVLIIILYSYYKSQPIKPPTVNIITGKIGGEVFPRINYSYSGIKLVLRRIYLALRRRVSCCNCTPREIYSRDGRSEVGLFARIYEEVVYGSKTWKGVEKTIDKLKRLLSYE